MKDVIFTDVHFGLNLNNEKRLNDASACIDWIISESVDRCGLLNRCFILGDWHDNRFNIGVKTLETARLNIRKLCDAFDQVYLIAGNHDCYYNDNNEITSIGAYDEIENLHLISTEVEVLNYDSGKIALCPWGLVPKSDRYLAILGHFALSGIRQPGGISSGIDLTPNELGKNSNLIFTGHYHLSGKYSTDAGVLHSVGSPYQHNWSDCKNPKGLFIVDFDSGEYEFVVNEVSPRFVKLPYSTLAILEEEQLKQLFCKLADHFIKIQIENAYEPDRLATMANLASVCRSYEVEYGATVIGELEKSGESIDELSVKPKRQYMKDYAVKLCKLEQFGHLDDKKLINLIDEYCDKLGIK